MARDKVGGGGGNKASAMDRMMAAIIIKRAAKRFLKRKREGKIPSRKMRPQRHIAGGTGA